jgi:hypothetical protein
VAGLAAQPWTLSWVVAFIALLASGGARAQSQPADEPSSPAVHLPRAVDVTAIREALDGARRRLANETCQRLFTEFADESGRPLAIALDGLGETGASYLGRLSFENGDGRPRCEQRQVGVLAFNHAGKPRRPRVSRLRERRAPLRGRGGGDDHSRSAPHARAAREPPVEPAHPGPRSGPLSESSAVSIDTHRLLHRS